MILLMHILVDSYEPVPTPHPAPHRKLLSTADKHSAHGSSRHLSGQYLYLEYISHASLWDS